MRTTGFAGLLLLAAGCAAPPPPRAETPLEKLRAKTNAYASFHYQAELTDGKRVVPIEIAWRAPDRALLRYGPNFTIVFADGTAHYLLKKNYFSINTAEMFEALRQSYGDLLPAPPQIVIVLGNWDMPIKGMGLLAAMEVRPLRSRLGWLDEVMSHSKEGTVHRWGAIDWELREDGFLEHVKIGSSAELVMKELTIDQPVDDALFAVPPHEDAADTSEGERRKRSEQLDEAFHRWVLEARPDAAAMEALVKVDLARRFEPAKMVEIQRKNLEDDLEAFRKQKTDSTPAMLRERTEITRGKTQANVDLMEEDLQKDFARRLDRYVGRKPTPEVSERWHATVARQVDLQIRRPLDQVFAEKLK
jgi:hypothetical protein